ncbi:glycosyltransferase family 4 protein [Hyphococcus sp.]|uniref:glycosyltransferase family 4 protein n=1 Tax=Hyphococcus sp. TaxID=2038636 RepID=UPI00208B7508|nr:MAG: undecaprenyl-phosphate alpha-N-acetylglucosaminyl 1-phosphate transferase [Marinicaulis sp.]
MFLIEPFVFASASAVTLAVVYGVSLFASQSRAILDQPNKRSSHTSAVSRIGGAAIFVGWLAGVFIVSAFADNLEAAGKLARLAVCGLLAFGLGFADDRFSLPPVWKLAGQIVIGALFTMLFAPLQMAPLPFLGVINIPPVWGIPITVFWIVTFMNAFNFMDGANGLAAGAAAVGLAWFSVIASFAGAPSLAVASLLLALACLGFLPANLVRGRLFMGDNGSMLLGFFIAAFAVLGVNWTGGRLCALAAPIIFLPLIFDVAWTLVSRVLRKQNVFDAHREHLYQLLMRMGVSHARVAVIYMGLVSLCAAAAIVMLTAAAALQWLAPLLLSVVFWLGAAIIYRKAVPAGLLAGMSEGDAALSAAS